MNTIPPFPVSLISLIYVSRNTTIMTEILDSKIAVLHYVDDDSSNTVSYITGKAIARRNNITC